MKYIVVSEANTPPTSPLEWSTELPLPTSKHVSREKKVISAIYENRGQVWDMLWLYSNLKLNVF